MYVIIIRKINLPAEPVDPFPVGDMFVIPMLVTDVRIDQENTGKSQGEPENAEDGIGRLPDQVFESDMNTGA
jgi:hypothetical protein